MSDYITEDTLALILKWLPAKSLLRFRSVCKRWKEFIDSPFILQEHLSVQKPSFLLQNGGNQPMDAFVVDPHTLPSVNLLGFPIEDKKFLFCGTYYGLVCLFDEADHYRKRDKLLIWNPSTRKLLTFPLPHLWECGWSYEHGFSWYCFWIDPSTKEYKILLLNCWLKDKGNLEAVAMEGILYSSTRKDWRIIGIPREELRQVVTCPPVMIQGVAHWRGNRYTDHIHVILSFDFALESFDIIHMPDHLQYGSSQPIHCHWQGNLSVLARDRESCDRYNMYTRQEGLWVNLFSFNVLPEIDKVFWVVSEGGGGVKVLAGNCGHLVLYDTRDGVVPFTNEDYDDRVRFSDDVHIAYDFVESLLFP